MKASLEEQINTFANRTQKDGVWDKYEEKLENFKLKNSALPIIYSYMTEEERAQIKIEKGEMFYMDFSFDTFLLPDLPAEPIWYDPLK
jgi:hypothetical protein